MLGDLFLKKYKYHLICLFVPYSLRVLLNRIEQVSKCHPVRVTLKDQILKGRLLQIQNELFYKKC